MDIKDVDEVQAQILLDLWECCGEEVALRALANADDDGWTQFSSAFIWSASTEGHRYWDGIDIAFSHWRNKHGR